MKKAMSCLILLWGLYLGLHNGYVALWDTDRADPVQVFPYRAAVYPKIDQNALEDGIPIQDQQHLKSLLESFLS